MTISINYSETNRPSTDLQHSDISNSVFDSSSVLRMPDPFFANQFNANNFIFNDYNILNPGPDDNVWTELDIQYGIFGLIRTGIGYFYFLNQKRASANYTTQEDLYNVNFWDYLTTFWNYLKADDRDLFENFWQGLSAAANDMISKANRLYTVMAPEGAQENPIENYYEIYLTPMTSKPLSLDPTQNNKNYIIRPLGLSLIEPQYDAEFNPTFRDIIGISSADYYKIRTVGLSCYVVVKVNNNSIQDRYFKVFNLLSSEEPVNTKQYAELNYTLNGDDQRPQTPPVTYTNNWNTQTIGTIGLTGLLDSSHTNYDVSQNLVQVIKSSSPASITWEPTSLLINVDKTSSHQISDMFDVHGNIICTITNPGNAWATIVNKSGNVAQNKHSQLPVFNPTSTGIDEFALRFQDLANFKAADHDNGRNYPANGKVWVWYDGWNNSNGGVAGADLTRGEWVPDPSQMQYLIVVDGDLSYIGSNTFSVYLTTGRAYDVDTYVQDMPSLASHITAGFPIEFVEAIDYTFNDHIVEFNDDIFSTGKVPVGEIVYCQKAPIIENYLYDSYGKMVGIPTWLNYNHNNFSGKTAINGVLKSLQNISTITDYTRALNAYYGTPIAPKDSLVVGLYESYDYTIVRINGNIITVQLFNGSALHKFIQTNSVFHVNGKPDVQVSLITDAERALGIIELVDASGLVMGDTLNLRLVNKFTILSVTAETATGNASVNIYSPEGPGAFQHMIDVVYTTSNQSEYPEILIYGTENLTTTSNYNGIYHIVEAIGLVDNVVKLQLYKKAPDHEPLYNDYIGFTNNNPSGSFIGYVHVPWPTHKYLYLNMNNGLNFFKAYLDAPIDTIFDAGDSLSQYQVIARNVSVLTPAMFPDWNQYNAFKKYSGLNVISDVLEVTKAMPYARFGYYFPSDFSANSAFIPPQYADSYQNTFDESVMARWQKTHVKFADRGNTGLPDMQNN